MVPTHQLVETFNLDLGNILQISDSHPAVVGVCTWRGEVLWIVDLAYLLGLTPLLTADYSQGKCSILRVKTQQHTFGVLIREVRQLVSCAAHQLDSGNYNNIASQKAHLIVGQMPTPEGDNLLVFDLEQILETLNQGQNI